MRIETLAFISLLLLAACASQEYKGSDTPDVALQADTLVLKDLLTPSSFATDSEGRIYALDAKAKEITTYTPEGTLIRLFGREGEGPGEFSRPVKVAVHKDRVMISERSGRVHIFDTTGTFLSSFIALGVIHMNSSFNVLDDSLVLLGGLREEAGDLYGGTLAHLYTTKGEFKKHFSEVSERSRTYKTSSIAGVNCDEDDHQTIWCVQLTDYVILNYSYSGDLIRAFPLEPDYFRPLREEEPEDNSKMPAWITSWDRPMTLFSVNDSILISEVFLGNGSSKIDIISKDRGHVLATRDAPGRLAYVDKVKQQLFFRLPATEEPETRFKLVPVEALMKGIFPSPDV